MIKDIFKEKIKASALLGLTAGLLLTSCHLFGGGGGKGKKDPGTPAEEQGDVKAKLELLVDTLPALGTVTDIRVGKWNANTSKFLQANNLPSDARKKVLLIPIYGLAGSYTTHLEKMTQAVAKKQKKNANDVYMLAPPSWSVADTCKVVKEQVNGEAAWMNNVFRLMRLAATSTDVKLIFLGHSKGGLIASAFVHTFEKKKDNNAESFDRIVMATFNTPFGGAGAWLKELSKNETTRELAQGACRSMLKSVMDDKLVDHLEDEGLRELFDQDSDYLAFAKKLPCEGHFFATASKDVAALQGILRVNGIKVSLDGDAIVSTSSQTAGIFSQVEKNKIKMKRSGASKAYAYGTKSLLHSDSVQNDYFCNFVATKLS